MSYVQVRFLFACLKKKDVSSCTKVPFVLTYNHKNFFMALLIVCSISKVICFFNVTQSFNSLNMFNSLT